MSAPLRLVLSDLARIEGVRCCMVVEKSGLVIEKTVLTEGLDTDKLAAGVAEVFRGAEKLSSELKIGDPDTIILEYTNGYLLARDIGNALLVVVADSRAVLGRLRFELKRQTERVRAAL